MTDKVHGFTATPDQFLSGGLVLFTATVSGVDLTATTTDVSEHTLGDVKTVPHAPALDKLIAAISIRAQPVIMGTPTATKLNFGVEHADIFGGVDANGKMLFDSELTAACGFTVVMTPFVF